MITPEAAVIAGDTTEDVFQACNEIGPRLTLDARETFTDIRLDYLAAYGMNGASDRMRGKTVRQIIDEYVPTNIEPRESGEIDGIQYSIYSALDPAVESYTNSADSGEPSDAPKDRASRFDNGNSTAGPR